MHEKLSERLAIVATVDPQSAAAGTYNTDVIDVSTRRRLLFAIATGAYGASGSTVDVQVYANASNSTSGGTAITGKTFTDSTFSGSAAGANKQGLIEVTDEDVAAAVDGGRYCYAVVTVGTNSAIIAVIVLAGDVRYHPASDSDLASVAEIVA